MSRAVSTMSCISMITDKSRTVIMFMFTIIIHTLNAGSSTGSSNLHKESRVDTLVNPTIWMSQPITATGPQRTNITTFIRTNSSVLFHDLRTLSAPRSTSSRFDNYRTHSEKAAGISTETISVGKYRISGEAQSRTTTLPLIETESQSTKVGAQGVVSELSKQNLQRQRLHSWSGFNRVSNGIITAENNTNVMSVLVQHSARPTMSTPSVVQHSARPSMSTPSVVQHSARPTMSTPSVVQHSARPSMSTPSVVQHSARPSMSTPSVVQHSARPSMSTPPLYHPYWSALLGKDTNSDNDVTALDRSIISDSMSKTLVISRKTFTVTSTQTLTAASQTGSVASAQPLRTSFPVESQVKAQPFTKAVPIQPTNRLQKKAKRSNFPEDLTSPSYVYLAELSQSSNITPTSTTIRMNTPAKLYTPPVSTANSLQSPPSLLDDDKSNRTPFIGVKLARNEPENIASSLDILDMHNKNPFVNSSQEKDLMLWFGSVGPVLRMGQGNFSSSNVSSLAHDNKTAFALIASDGPIPCNDNCSRRHGVCVMGNDFKLHCVVVDDACEQFPCANGHCVATDGLYKCECHAGWVGTFCDTPCTLECGQNGYCGRFEENDTVVCICHWNYTGYRCQDKRKIVHSIMEVPASNRDMQVWEIAVVVTTIATFLALFCVLLPYLLWRRQWIPIRKLIFYFQEYEDDDEKEYDAFISYKSTPQDEKFILQHLYPKLEKELNFKLCLHFRDFPPGEPIANNIIRAIEGSRRTILVLSPSFISSEWCRMEYQKAQYEMLKLKHKIIPIILEDISDMPEIDKNLQNIMDTVTYITWPGDEESASSKRLAKFWMLLELSMPKRKSEHHRCSTSSCSSMPLSNVDSIVSSLSEADSPASSASIDDRSVSETSISSLDSTELSQEAQDASIDQPRYSSIPQDGLKNNRLGRVTHNPGSCREEVVNVNSGSEEAGKETNVKRLSVFDEVMKGIVNSRKTPFNECEKYGILDNQSSGSDETTKGNNKYSGTGQTNVFLSSDDHIVEIREAGRDMKGVRIKPRPRQLFV